MKIKNHLKSFGWIYATGAAVVLVGAMTSRMQRLPAPDRDTLLAFVEEYERQVEEQLGPPVPDRYFELLDTFELSDLAMLPHLDGDMALATFDGWLERVGGALEEFALLSTEGLTNVMLTSAILRPGEPSSRDIPNFLTLQSRSKIHRLLALRAMEEGDWETALRELRYGAHAGTPSRYHYLIGLLIAIATRAIAYDGYARMLAHDLPAEVLEEALTDLEALAETDAGLNEWVMLTERMFMILYVAGRFAGGVEMPWADEAEFPHAQRLQPHLAAASHAVRNADRLRTPSLRRYAERNREAFARGQYEVVPTGVRFFQHGGLHWTAIPGMTRFLRNVIETEPEFVRDVMEDYPFSFEEGDPWTRAVYLTSWDSGANIREVVARSRVTRTRGALLREAYAARLEQARTGEWPGPPEMDAADVGRAISEVQDEGEAPYLPMQSRLIPRDEFTVIHDVLLIQNRTDVGRIARHEDRFHLSAPAADGSSRFRVAFPSNLTPDRMMSLPDQFGRIAEDVTVTIRPPALRDWPHRHIQAGGADWMGPMMTEMTFLPPPDPEEERARQLADWRRYVGEDAPMPAPLARERAENMAAMNIRYPAHDRYGHWDDDDVDSRFLEFIRNVDIVVEGTFVRPEQTRVLWSPGPDGVDDRAMIPYDPTNGTLSRGDIIIFP